MPALVGLAPLVVALMAALLAIAADLIIRAIASQLPKINLVVATIKLGDIFANIATSVVNWCIGNLDKYFDDIANWFVGHALVFDQALGAVVQAVSHLGDQIAHIVTHVIPNAIKAAESAAGAVTAKAISDVELAISKAAKDTGQALTGVDAQIYKDVSAIEGGIANDIKAAAGAAVHTAESYTDGAITTVTHYIDHEIGDAEAIAAAATTALAKTLGGQLSALANTVAQNLDTAEQYAKAQASSVYNQVESDLAGAEATLGAGITAAQKAASAAAQAAASDLTTAEQFATSQVASGVATAEQFASTAAAGAATDAEQALEGAFGGLYQDLTGQSLANEGDLSATLGLVAGAILTAVGSVAARVAAIEECYVGVCSTNPNNFTNLLQDALGLISGVSVFAFLAELVQDPAGAEAKYADVIGGTFTAGQSLFDSLLSL